MSRYKKGNLTADWDPAMARSNYRVVQFARTFQDVADSFSTILECPLLDRTGLHGEFDFTVEYAAEGNQSIADLAGPELSTALQE